MIHHQIKLQTLASLPLLHSMCSGGQSTHDTGILIRKPSFRIDWVNQAIECHPSPPSPHHFGVRLTIGVQINVELRPNSWLVSCACVCVRFHSLKPNIDKSNLVPMCCYGCTSVHFQKHLKFKVIHLNGQPNLISIEGICCSHHLLYWVCACGQSQPHPIIFVVLAFVLCFRLLLIKLDFL